MSATPSPDLLADTHRHVLRLPAEWSRWLEAGQGVRRELAA